MSHSHSSHIPLSAFFLVKAVEEMGTAVLHGATSTFLAVVVLAGSKSFIFEVFFKQFFAICLFGALHGLVLLPVLLSYLGPREIDVEGKHAEGKEAGEGEANTAAPWAAVFASRSGVEAGVTSGSANMPPPLPRAQLV